MAEKKNVDTRKEGVETFLYQIVELKELEELEELERDENWSRS